MNSIAKASRLGPQAQRIYTTLASDIREGRYPANTRLPSEKALCQTFAVSRTPVRRAIQRLVEERLVASRRGSGTHVLTPDQSTELTNVISLMYNGDAALLTDVQDLVFATGCTLSLYSQVRHGWAPEQEAFFLRQVALQRHRGLLANCSPIKPFNLDLLRTVQQTGTRVIHVEPYDDALPPGEYVMPDYRRAGAAGAVALMLAGHQHLFFAQMDNPAPYERLQAAGFADALRDQGRLNESGPSCCLALRPGGELPPPDQARLKAAVQTGQQIGCMASSLERASVIREHLLRLGATHSQIGLTAVQLAAEPARPDEQIDALVFDRLGIYRDALTAINTQSADSSSVQILASPRLEKC